MKKRKRLHMVMYIPFFTASCNFGHPRKTQIVKFFEIKNRYGQFFTSLTPLTNVQLGAAAEKDYAVDVGGC